MSVSEIAQDLANLCRSGNFLEAMEKYYDDEIESVEPMGPEPVSAGLDAVRAKSQWWMENFEVHGVEISGPFVNENTQSFAVGFLLDATNKQTGERRTMNEIGVYVVEDEKIIEEQFLTLSSL